MQKESSASPATALMDLTKDKDNRRVADLRRLKLEIGER
jgi:hypothetical protein